MTYCPECGSEVAPENTFCAYCGIALTPIVAAVEEPSLPESDSSIAESEQAVDETKLSSPETEESKTAGNSNGGLEEGSDENLPPTLTAYDNQLPKNDWSDQLIHPDSINKAGEETAQSVSMKTESEISPSFNIDEVKKDETKSTDENPAENLEEIKNFQSAPSPDPVASDNVGFAKAPVSNLELESQNAEPENLSSWDDFSVQPKAPSEPEMPPAQEDIKPPVDFENSINPEFEATIPYTPKDYAKQDLVASKTSGEVDSVNKSEEVVPEEVQPPIVEEPISKPDIPVGSSAHDSLEPKLVSVQIYNPDEKPESPEEESLHDSQTLLKHPPQSQKLKEEVSKESRSYTSPNMGREDTAGKNKAKLKPLDEGTVLNGRYEIIRKIGGGGMGAVYLASDRNLGGVLRAVKEMVQSYIEDAQQEKAINDFKRESLLLTSLEHQAIPTIYDYFYDEKEGRFYLVMKYISGGDLAGRMRSAAEGRLDEATVTEWGIQIADVLDYLHNRQPPIVYRDLKPSNIMIDGNNGRIMLIDFGIARWVNKEEKGVTAVGTMGYAPPELFSGNVEPRSDIYSLGSTMFHLLTGADPQSNPLLIFDFNKNPRPRQINSSISDQIEQILLRMVEYNADRRFTNAAELRDALTKHLESLKKGAVTFGVASSAPSPAASNELVFCGFCGQKIVATDVFCPFCGAQQPQAGQSSNAAPAYIQPKLTARILVIGTNDLDTPMFNLEKDTNLVGRRDPMSNIFPEVDLSKFDPQTKISRKHARIWRESEKYMVEDLGSSNGTVLITKSQDPLRLVKNQPHVLHHGDKLRVGDTTLHFVLG